MFKNLNERQGNMKNKNFLLFLVITMAISSNVSFAYETDKKKSRPNILLLVVDALRADSLGCYNELSSNTPNIDSFSKRSVLFENPVAQASNTFNAAPCMLASVYPSEHKYFNYKVSVSKKFTTIAELMKNENYTTFGISTNPHVTKKNGLTQGFDTFIENTVWKDTNCDEVNRMFIEWHKANKDKSFFSMLWYVDPHSPYEPPLEYIKKYIVDDDEKKAITNRAKSKAGRKKGPITKIEKRVAKKLYAGEVNFFDTEFGELARYLENSGLMENTIIILTSDHGESFWEKGIRGHGGSLYEEEIKIPLIIYLPGQREGKVILSKVQHVDLLPTILEYVNPQINIASIPYVKGSGLKHLIEGGASQVEYFFSQLIDTRTESMSYHVECVQNANFKLIQTFTSRGKVYSPPIFELFDLRDGEVKCEFNDKQYRAIYDELRNELVSWAHSYESQGTKSVENPNDSNEHTDENKKLLQRLKSLGYIE